jgi:hypothetical protein
MTSRRHVERAIERYADELSAFPNVVGIGMSEADGDDRPRTERALAVAVYVSDKKPMSELDASELLPGFVEVDDKGDSVKVPVKVIEMGEVHPEGDRPDGTENQSNEGDDSSTFSAQ